MVDQKTSQNFDPLNMILKNDQKRFDTCSATHLEGYIMLTLNNLCKFQYTRPNLSPISPGHDIAHAEAFILRNKKPITHHQSPIMSELTFRETSKSSPREMLSIFSNK